MGDLSSATSTISIVLGVLTYFLTLVLDKSRIALDRAVPSAAQENLRKRRKDLVALLLSAVSPLLFAFGLLFYLCLPTLVSIEKSSTFQLWHFDLITTLFVFLNLTIGILIVTRP